VHRKLKWKNRPNLLKWPSIYKVLQLGDGENAILSLSSKRMLFLVLFISLGISCGKSKSEPTLTPMPTVAPVAVLAETENFKFVDCPFQIPGEMPQNVVLAIQCGNLTVPEDRKQPDGPQIKLAVVIVKTTSTTPKPDPLLVLISNPGYGLDLALNLPYIFENIYTQRDLIIIDQRGTGFSQPSFSCPEFDDLSHEAVIQNFGEQEANNRYVEATRTCANRVKASTSNLPAYTTAAVAADLEDLRLALGVSQWNIFTLFDGSILALTMMRDYPQAIRSVIMDSVVPLQADPIAELGTNVESAFDRLFQRCAEDEDCSKTYPKLKTTFYSLLDQLNEQAVAIDVADLTSGERYKVMLDSDHLTNFIMLLLNSSIDRESLPEIPRMIYQLEEGKTEVIARLMGNHPLFGPSYSAMGQWMDCNEEYHFSTLELVTKANTNVDLRLQKYINSHAEGIFRACEEWGVPGVSETENQAVTSSIPTLLLSGEFDWNAPPAWADWTAQTLSNSTVLEFPGTGPIVYLSGTSSSCAHKIVNTFLETPTSQPDTSCASKPIDLLWVTLP
jgi:pimeloyl-ACP methyl ester carboxylesterase